ncbi:hypothetical protein [Paracidovorax anthurii]|uniref:Uncharacterized protein n=1 Tax=Paracidovorax anthurii TaxID=78229 RepID=A0A328Z705_9BURK|nr:hypothetical protein [Paracidovorax anthurii]RAR78537.1 hypothetical protein AX018_103038 [Paracidovorax anthurii]
MLLVKTPAGQLALKDRNGGLTSRQRSAFILFDGQRTVAQVLAATAAMGISMEDVQTMVDQGLLESPGGKVPVLRAGAPAGDAAAAPAPSPGVGMALADRYQNAYRVATELTASLGLKGFRLNLAVEGARSMEELAALAPKIRELVGDEKYRRLQEALFG